jgi:hypothetical protein
MRGPMNVKNKLLVYTPHHIVLYRVTSFHPQKNIPVLLWRPPVLHPHNKQSISADSVQYQLMHIFMLDLCTEH